ncbi:MAG: BatA domain-containing protein, partial [Pirellulaceae bacterium]|nr:BatA domain-containing protein [Pirellulaceae bacterium]
MAFLNLSLLFGAGLVAVPIILHLAMRRKPKKLIFPALRFLQQRQESNRRKLQLRHLLLLLLRCLVIALIAIALARPSAASSVASRWLVVWILGVISAVIVPLAVLCWVQKRSKLL